MNFGDWVLLRINFEEEMSGRRGVPLGWEEEEEAKPAESVLAEDGDGTLEADLEEGEVERLLEGIEELDRRVEGLRESLQEADTEAVSLIEVVLNADIFSRMNWKG